jgi:hypothetical protein
MLNSLTARMSLGTLQLIFDRLLQVGVCGWLYIDLSDVTAA